MTALPEVLAAVTVGRCTETTEFGRCGYKAGGHTRHRAKTIFGEMEWSDPADAEATPDAAVLRGDA